MKSKIVFLMMFACLVSCGKKKNSNDDDDTNTPSNTGSPTDEDVIVINTLGALNITQKNDASTPEGFKESSSLYLADRDPAYFAICRAKFPASSDEANLWACFGAYDARERFFQGGPTAVRDVVKRMDDRLNFYVSMTGIGRYPCLDPSYQGGLIGGQEYPVYSLKDFATKTAFSDGYSLDFGRTYYFSCKEKMGGDSSPGSLYVYLGAKDGVTYLGETQRADDSSPTIISLMTVDADDNIEIIEAIAPKDLSDNTAVNPEAAGSVAIYTQSSGFAQFVVRPKEGIYGASDLMDTGCEQRLVMNDTAAYVETNGNNYGSCYAEDVWVSEEHPYNPLRDHLKVCLKVSDAEPEPQDDLSLCEAAGLLVSDEHGGYKDPFERYGIMRINNNTANPPTDGWAVRPFYAPRILPDFGEGVTKMQLIEYKAKAAASVEGYLATSLSFTKAAGSKDKDAASVTAACNADAADKEKSFSQVFEFPVSTYVNNYPRYDENQKAKLLGEEGEVAPEPLTDDDIIAILNTNLTNTDTAAPNIATRLSRSIGPTFHAIGTGTITLKYDNTVIGKVTVDQSKIAAKAFYNDVKIPFETVPTVEATGKFTLIYQGKTTLVCNNSSVATSRKVTTSLGNPMFIIYGQNAPPPAAELR